MSDSLLSEADGKSREALGGIALCTSILQEYIEKVNSRANNPINKAVLLQRAWHGSPHDFASFDLGAIGTGEGAQAHGWGLYFAQNRELSEGYQKRLADNEYDTIQTSQGEYKFTYDGDVIDVAAKKIIKNSFRAC